MTKMVGPTHRHVVIKLQLISTAGRDSSNIFVTSTSSPFAGKLMTPQCGTVCHPLCTTLACHWLRSHGSWNVIFSNSDVVAFLVRSTNAGLTNPLTKSLEILITSPHSHPPSTCWKNCHQSNATSSALKWRSCPIWNQSTAPRSPGVMPINHTCLLQSADTQLGDVGWKQSWNEISWTWDKFQ